MRIILIIIFNLSYITLGFANINGLLGFDPFGGSSADSNVCNAISGPMTINGRDIIVPNDTPVGTLLATFTSSSFNTYRCDDNVKNMVSGGKLYGEFATLINGIRVYKTNIAGIGYTLGVQSMCQNMAFPTKGWKDQIDNIDVCLSNKGWERINHNFEVGIYKIGAIENGIIEKKKKKNKLAQPF